MSKCTNIAVTQQKTLIGRKLNNFKDILQQLSLYFVKYCIPTAYFSTAVSLSFTMFMKLSTELGLRIRLQVGGPHHLHHLQRPQDRQSGDNAIKTFFVVTYKWVK